MTDRKHLGVQPDSDGLKANALTQSVPHPPPPSLVLCLFPGDQADVMAVLAVCGGMLWLCPRVRAKMGVHTALAKPGSGGYGLIKANTGVTVALHKNTGFEYLFQK